MEVFSFNRDVSHDLDDFFPPFHSGKTHYSLLKGVGDGGSYVIQNPWNTQAHNIYSLRGSLLQRVTHLINNSLPSCWLSSVKSNFRVSWVDGIVVSGFAPQS